MDKLFLRVSNHSRRLFEIDISIHYFVLLSSKMHSCIPHWFALFIACNFHKQFFIIKIQIIIKTSPAWLRVVLNIVIIFQIYSQNKCFYWSGFKSHTNIYPL